MIKKIKTIIIYTISIIAVFLVNLLIGKNYINILGTTIDNTLGSYSIQLDYDNYSNDNYFDISNGVYCQPLNQYSYNELTNNNNVYYSLENGTLNINNAKEWSGWCSSYMKIDPNTKYIFDTSTNLTNELIRRTAASFSVYDINLNVIYSTWLDNYRTFDNEGFYMEYNSPTNAVYFRFFLYTRGNEGTSDWGPRSYQVIKPLLYKDNKPNNYSIPFVFGLNVDLALNYTLSSSNADLGINVKLNNNTCYSRNVTLSNSNSYIRINDVCYIPFNIQENGYFSLEETKLSVDLSGSSALISSINWQSGFILTPILQAYYKGEYTELLYLKNSYLTNALFYNGFTARVEGNTISEELNKPSLFTTENNKLSGLYRLSDSNQTLNIIGKQIDNVSFINLIDLNNSLNFTLGFDFGKNETLSSINNLDYIFSFSGINTIVIGNDTSTTPIPGSTNENEIYSVCSAWYDIPCQLGNALTYVVYKAPIISPIIQFVSSIASSLYYLVTYLKWFETLGIVFSVFILILFIRMIITLIGSKEE